MGNCILCGYAVQISSGSADGAIAQTVCHLSVAVVMVCALRVVPNLQGPHVIWCAVNCRAQFLFTDTHSTAVCLW